MPHGKLPQGKVPTMAPSLARSLVHARAKSIRRPYVCSVERDRPGAVTTRQKLGWSRVRSVALVARVRIFPPAQVRNVQIRRGNSRNGVAVLTLTSGPPIARNREASASSVPPHSHQGFGISPRPYLDLFRLFGRKRW